MTNITYEWQKRYELGDNYEFYSYEWLMHIKDLSFSTWSKIIHSLLIDNNRDKVRNADTAASANLPSAPNPLKITEKYVLNIISTEYNGK